MKPPFFVFGTQRSGTTLLLQMLNAHPELFVFNEFYHLERLIAERPDRLALCRYLTERLRLPAGKLEREVDPTADAFSHLERAFALKLEQLGKLRWAIKDPRMTYFADAFRRRCPQARFVCIVRDGRGVVSSYLGRKMNVANVWAGAHLWREEVDRQNEFARRHPEVSHRLRFESLLVSPEEELRRLCTFLEEPFHPRMLQYFEHQPETRVHEGNINILRPPRPEIAERWRSALTARQVALVETIAGDRLQAEGYELSAGPIRLSGAEKLFYRVHQKVMTTYWWQRRSRWQGVRNRLRRAFGAGEA